MPIYVSWRGLNGVQGQVQHAFNQPSEIREHVKEENTSPTSSSAQAICSMTPLFCGLRIYIIYTFIHIYICTKSKLQGLTPLPVARVRSLGNVLTALKRTRLMGSQSGVQILSICTYTYPSECID